VVAVSFFEVSQTVRQRQAFGRLTEWTHLQ